MCHVRRSINDGCDSWSKQNTFWSNAIQYLPIFYICVLCTKSKKEAFRANDSSHLITITLCVNPQGVSWIEIIMPVVSHYFALIRASRSKCYCAIQTNHRVHRIYPEPSNNWYRWYQLQPDMFSLITIYVAYQIIICNNVKAHICPVRFLSIITPTGNWTLRVEPCNLNQNANIFFQQMHIRASSAKLDYFQVPICWLCNRALNHTRVHVFPAAFYAPVGCFTNLDELARCVFVRF